jgi:mycoredoxin
MVSGRFDGQEGRLSNTASKIIMYGTVWCYATKRARNVLDENHIPYDYIDIDYDAEARAYVEKVNNGFRSVPTIVFPDGSMLVEPTNDALKRKLGVA